MAVQTRRMTGEEFERFVELPENAARRFEYIGGEAVEMVSNQRSSMIAARLLSFIGMYVISHDLGFVTGADGGYAVAEGRYIPGVAFVAKARQSQAADRPYGPIPPDLAVEVLSPSDDPEDMRIKIVNYLNAGTTVWVVNPDRKRVEVYAPGAAPQKFDLEDSLDGGAALPGFSLALTDIFPD